MARKPKLRNHANIVKHHPEDPHSKSKTEAQWLKEGRIVTGPGELMFTNSNFSKAMYYTPEETREATPAELASIKAQKKVAAQKKKKQKESLVEEYSPEVRKMRAKRSQNYARLWELKELRNSLPAENVLCLDTETTGFGANDEMLQISLVNGRGEVMFDELLRPQHMTSWPGAEAVNGISPEMVADKPSIDTYEAELNRLFSNAKLIIGYNLDFDLGFIRRAGIEVSKETTTADVMYLAAPVCGCFDGSKFRWVKLCECAEYFGYDGSGYHNALADTQATLFCFDQLLDLMKDAEKLTVEEMEKFLFCAEVDLYPYAYMDSVFQSLWHRRRDNAPDAIEAEKLFVRTMNNFLPGAIESMGTVREDGTLEPVVPKVLTPSFHGEDCLGVGKWPYECQCPDCDWYQTICFPDWESEAHT